MRPSPQVALRAEVVPPRHPAVAPSIALYAVLMVAWSIVRHAHFGSYAHDLAAYDNAFYNLAHTGVPYNAIERVHQFSNHLEIGLMWLALPYRVAPSPAWLFAVQQVSVALAALPVESLARHASRDRAVGLISVFAFLLTPQLIWGQVLDFHSIVVCTFPMALLAWGVERDSRLALAAGGVLAMSLREQMGLALAAAGVAWVLRHGAGGRRLHAAAFVALGIAHFVVVVLWIIPSFQAGGAPFRYIGQYQRLGGSTAGALRFAVEHPLRLLWMPFEGRRPLYLLLLTSGMIPLLLVALRKPGRTAWPLLVAAPLLLVQLLNDHPDKWNVHFQYGAPVVPLVAASAVLALATLRARGSALPRAAALAWLGATGIHALIDAVPRAYGPGKLVDPGFAGSRREAALHGALARIPPGASVSAQRQLAPHASDRPVIRQWPDGENECDIVWLDDAGDRLDEGTRELLRVGIPRLRGDARHVPIFDEAGVLLFARSGGAATALVPLGGSLAIRSELRAENPSGTPVTLGAPPSALPPDSREGLWSKPRPRSEGSLGPGVKASALERSPAPSGRPHDTVVRMAFAGFPKETVRFLAGLSKNNEKAWFDAHRDDYEAHLIAPAKAFVEAMAPRLKKIDPALRAEPRVNGSIFRMHRDVRFAKDKSPYKDHLDLWFWAGDKKGWDCSGFFFRLTPKKLMLGAGMHGFMAPVLARYRSAVQDAAKGAALARIVTKLRKDGYDVGGESYKKTPRGVDADHPRAALLRHGGLHAGWEGKHPAELHGSGVVDFVAERFGAVAPVHAWLSRM